MIPLAAQRATLRMSSAVNIVCDGNSLVAGYGASDFGSVIAPTKSWPGQMAALAPVQGSGATVTNAGISAQTWRQLNGLDGGSASDIDGAWVAGKANVLIAWETTNSVYTPVGQPQRPLATCRATSPTA